MHLVHLMKLCSLKVVRLMIEDDFSVLLQHSICSEGNIEISECFAYKLDDVDGLSNHLGFSNNTLSKVDYFSKCNNCIQLIELSDLEDSIDRCTSDLDSEIKIAENVKGERLTTREIKPIRKKSWSPVINEFKNKWYGSIAIIERLYRKNKIYDDDPSYQLLIVSEIIANSFFSQNRMCI
jgi:hypothetical protein